MPSSAINLSDTPLILLGRLQSLIQRSLILEAEALRNPHNEEVDRRTKILAEDIEALTQELETLERGLGDCLGVTCENGRQNLTLGEVSGSMSVKSPRRRRLRRVGKFEKKR
ncbi:MAG: hypothetical protein MMC33_001630 [Icmadophila ericetorum]|nr:hypothetical protein [Icmadophila ericetorum]